MNDMNKYTWAPRRENFPAEENLRKELGLSSLTAKLLVNRGLASPDEADLFLNGTLNDIAPPESIAGMDQAVSIIKETIQQNGKIALFGDYDCDGLTSTATFNYALEELNIYPLLYIPDRLTEGYGLSEKAIDSLISRGATLLITFDCGVSDTEAVAYARKHGLKVIICDHHVPPVPLPNADVILNPKLPDSVTSFKDLAGVGVSWKLAWCLLGHIMGEAAGKRFMEDNLDLVALGTYADMVPLIGENRIIVRSGLNRMASKLGLAALMTNSGINLESPSETDIVYKLAPKINVAGRLGTPLLAYELLTTSSSREAYRISESLSKLNDERRILQQKVFQEASRQYLKSRKDRVGLVLSSEDWHPGVIGIAASKMVETYGLPAVLISFNNGRGKGSGRGIPETDLHAVMAECSSLLESFGGHRMAAGLSLKRENLSAFETRFNELVLKSIETVPQKPKLCFDGEIDIETLTLKMIQEIDCLRPFGQANPEPVFVANKLTSTRTREVGRNHLKMGVKKLFKEIDTIGFGLGKALEPINSTPAGRLDLAFNLRINHWNKRESIQLNLLDIKAC
ncbi:MAG: single-stranded-DNA-specific exonuclease RecJ [bacterium]